MIGWREIFRSRRGTTKDEMMTQGQASRPTLDIWDAEIAGWFNHETGEVFKGLRITSDDVVLDVGCGDGGTAGFCATRGAAIMLTDADPQRVAAAERNLASLSARSVQAVVSDSNPLPFPDGVASVVVSTEVIEHVEDPAVFLKELVRVGKPGARYLLTVPDPVGEKLQKTLAPPSYFERPNHIRIIERDEFAAMVEAAGLIVESRGSYGFYWSMWWMFFWACHVDLGQSHPLLDSWKQTWTALLETDDGEKIKKVFDAFMPKSQLIIARKP